VSIPSRIFATTAAAILLLTTFGLSPAHAAIVNKGSGRDASVKDERDGSKGAQGDKGSGDRGRSDRSVGKGSGLSDEERKKLAEKAKKREKEIEAAFEKCVKKAEEEGNPQALEDCRQQRMYVLDELKASLAVSPEEAARRAVARLRVPVATPVFGPDPKLNLDAPGNLVVGFPYWLSVPGPATMSESVTQDGLTITMKATRTSAEFVMGDGATVSCTETLPWPGADRGLDRRGVPLPSPVCGHRYSKTGDVTISTTVRWDVAWSAGGVDGVIPLTVRASASHRVVTLETRVVR